MPSEKPLGSPSPDSGQIGERLDNVGIAQPREGRKVEVASGDLQDEPGLAPRETKIPKLGYLYVGYACGGRKRVHQPVLSSETLDESVANGERSMKRDLLRSDRAHNHLEGVWHQEWPHTAQRREQLFENGVRGNLALESSKVERCTEDVAEHAGDGRLIVVDRDTSGDGARRDSATRKGSDQSFPIDHVDTIRTERTDPGDGLREVERLGNGDEHGAA